MGKELAAERIELERSLEERLKELNCLYAIARVSEKHPQTIGPYIKEIAEILPAAWQYPEIAGARIEVYGKAHKSRDFARSEWVQRAPIKVSGEPVGEVAIHYREERPPAYEGPFLKEERELINEVAKRVAEKVKRIETERKLRETLQTIEEEQKSAEEANTALRILIKRIHEDRDEVKQSLQSNVEKILLPILDEMDLVCNTRCKRYIALLRTSLAESTSPFTHGLARQSGNLSPTEIQICNMIRNGMRTKDIAAVRRVSSATIHRHRERIRKKLGITNSGANLVAHLESIGKPEPVGDS